jgi:hypothetical protein
MSSKDKSATCSFTGQPRYRNKSEAEKNHPGEKVVRCGNCRWWEPRAKGRRR